jgi:molybdate transport system regulatory protein
MLNWTEPSCLRVGDQSLFPLHGIGYAGMLTRDEHTLQCKIWLEHEGRPLIGKGGATILQTMASTNSITKAAQTLGMSYKYVWNYLAKIERNLQQPIVETYKGGKKGGGGATLTLLGHRLLTEYKRVESYLGEILEDQEYWEAIGLKISARNRIKGVIKQVEKGIITAKVIIQIETPTTITAIISKEATEELNLRPGDKAQAVIKATEVLIAKET